MQTLSTPASSVAAEPSPRRVAIIGMGPRGLGVLEQLIALARDTPELPLRIDLFDPRAPGSGLHHADQPDYLMLNTMAGQLSAFSCAYPGCEPPGPTFLQWCIGHDIRLDDRGHVAGAIGRAVEFGDFVPRKLLGRYLQDSYRFLVQRCPAHVRVRHHAEAIERCCPLPGRPGFGLTTESGWQLACDAVLLTTGHAPRTPEPDNLGARVAIEGLGLSAMDTLAHLTQGRGGQFVRDKGFAGWRYRPSEHEPRLFLYSRTGLPFCARPQWAPPGQPGSGASLPRLYFTASAIGRLRTGASGGQLDFRQDVLPLIEAEMRAVFYQARVRLQAPDRLAGVQCALRQAASRDEQRAVFARLANHWGAFEPRDWLRIEPWRGAADQNQNQNQYASGFVRWIERDLALSRLGVGQSPVKQALEVWRDYRDLLRQVTDRGGLTDSSTLDFYANWVGLSNRLVGGPQKERHEDLLALIRAGVVTLLAPGSEPLETQGFDRVIGARVAHSGLSAQRRGAARGLLGDLLDQGQIRAAHPYPADGLQTDRLGRPVRRDGSIHERLWVLGPMVEGCTFYNHYIATPDPGCRAPTEARLAARSCLDALVGMATACA